MYQASPTLAAAMLNALKGALDNGFVYLFAGPVPASALDPLDMDNDHTEVAKLSVDADGTTGLTFDTAVQAIINKAAAESWRGVVMFDGAEDAETTLAPTFLRFCAAGDNGRNDGTGLARLQCTAGGPSSSADARLASDTLTANGSNETGASVFQVTLSSLG